MKCSIPYFHHAKMAGLLMLIGACGAHPLRAQSAIPLEKPRTPVHAAELLKLLPQAPEGWSVTRSGGKSTFSEWVRAEATREYTGPLPVSPDAEGKPAPTTPPVVTLSVIDTGGFANFLQAFQNFQLGQLEGGIEKRVVQQNPAIISKPPSGGEQIQLCVESRFIVRIAVTGPESIPLSQWLRMLDLSQFRILSAQGGTELVEPLDMYVIDELNPRRNRSYKLEWTTEEDVEEALRASIPPGTGN